MAQISNKLVRRVEHVIELYEELENPDKEDNEDLAYWCGFMKACELLRNKATEREVLAKVEEEILSLEDER
jgi:hypothetical protein